jgi:glycosyltransferase involved in cell wall biosynthesis
MSNLGSSTAVKQPYPSVSIIINNYNYGIFLPAAIDSALSQTYPHVEVIVVDDGSTDSSRKIIAGYSPRIISVLKENGGQASSFNQGFAIAQGEIILFLDSDDVLQPDIVTEVVSAFQARADAVKVQFHLQVIDADNQVKDEIHPPLNYNLPSNLPAHILDFYNYTWPPTSGNAFRASMLRQILPMPTATYRIAADAYLNLVGVLYGAVVPLHRVGGWYRVHGQNGFYFKNHQVNLAQLQKLVTMTIEIQAKQRELLKTIHNLDVKAVGRWDLGTLKNKTILLKLSPQTYPSVDSLSEHLPDSLLQLCGQGCIAALRGAIGWRARVLHLVWFSLIPFVSQDRAIILTNFLLYPEFRQQMLNQRLTGHPLLQKMRLP